MTEYAIGIDIGSTCAKTAVMANDEITHKLIQPTGWSSVDTAESIRQRLTGLDIGLESAAIVATGYGRVSVPYANKTVTEITCHGKGACFIHGADELTVIDIGGQDTKIITVAHGAVTDFMMNDKCSAGTGRFLEVMANTLGVRPDELCQLAAKGGGVSISSMCTVFAESEVISLIGRGESKENIAFGVVDSIVKKVASQCSKVRLMERIALTGGLCGCEYIRTALSEELGRTVEAREEGRYAGAIGAALCAANM